MFGQPKKPQGDRRELPWSFQTDHAPLQADIQDDAWIDGIGFGRLTDLGEHGLVAGTYEATVAFDQTAGPTLPRRSTPSCATTGGVEERKAPGPWELPGPCADGQRPLRAPLERWFC